MSHHGHQASEWKSHPDHFHIRYEKVSVVVGEIDEIRLRIRNGHPVVRKESHYPLKFSTMRRAAYNNQGALIGSVDKARFICRVLGIKPEKIDAKHKVCTIGKSRKDGRWYAFTHRGYTSFAVGEAIKKESWQGRYLHLFHDLNIENELLARDMAATFAEAIS